MEEYIEQNRRAWEYDAYNFWVKQSGTPAERAKEDAENPRAMLRKTGAMPAKPRKRQTSN